MIIIRTLASLVFLILAGLPAKAQTKLPVVASFSIVGDFVREIGGERIALSVLVGPGGDAHVYSPSPQDAKTLAAAKVIFVNGLKFEGWIERLIKASATEARVVTVSDGITVRRLPSQGHGHAHGHKDKHGHDHSGGVDPHAWQSLANAKIYVRNIRDALALADPAGKTEYDARATAYLARLDELERHVKERIAALPRDRRKIVTSHDAFGYFAAAYGLTFLAPRGVSTDAEPSARQIGELIRQIKREKIRAIFVESITDKRMIERIASETGAVIGGALFSDSLSPPDGPAGTYETMMRHNVETLTRALGGSS
jgi:zinc/manganese transport system substrate-binding protein